MTDYQRLYLWIIPANLIAVIFSLISLPFLTEATYTYGIKVLPTFLNYVFHIDLFLCAVSIVLSIKLMIQPKSEGKNISLYVFYLSLSGALFYGFFSAVFEQSRI